HCHSIMHLLFSNIFIYSRQLKKIQEILRYNVQTGKEDFETCYPIPALKCWITQMLRL
ncbi:hypothetical protein L9F63_017370, partial [Diploptera punctata]